MILNISIGLVVLISIVVFLVIIMLLVSVLLYARTKLMPSGEVKLTINEEKEFTVNPGSTILSTLANEKIFLPSACGGGGTCAMCKCQVFEGGGSILPTEVMWQPLSRSLLLNFLKAKHWISVQVDISKLMFLNVWLNSAALKLKKNIVAIGIISRCGI